MGRILTRDLLDYVDKKVVVKGWVHRIRKLSNVNFILLRDRTGIVQVVLEPNLLNNLTISVESVVEISGVVHKEARAPGGFEIFAEELAVLALAATPPINVNGPNLNITLETMLDNRVLSLRHHKINPIFKIQSALVQGFQAYLDQQGFTQVFTPKIVAGGTEGGTELFALDYFEQTAYLAQSPQFYKQMMVGAGYERVYEIGPVFRAEKHATSRHLNEYISLDLEMSFIANEQTVMGLQNRLLQAMFCHLAKSCQEELILLNIELPEVPKIPQIPLLDALKLLEQEYGKIHLEKDLDPEGERLLSKYFLEQTGSEFVFVTDYPWEKRPMYTMPKGDNLTASFDLLFRGLEITTGGQRIHEYKQLKENMLKKGLEPQQFSSYLNNFRWGMPPHGGLAIGLERLTAKIVGLGNVREASLFPRDRFRLTP